MEEPDSPDSQSADARRPGQWDQFTRQAAIVILILGALLLLRVLRPLLDMLAVTGLFILIYSYPVNAVRVRTRMSYPLAALIVFVPLTILVLPFFGILIHWSVGNLQSLSGAMQARTSAIQAWDDLLVRLTGGNPAGGRALESLAAELTRRVAFMAQFITLTGISFLLSFLFILEMPSNLARSFQGLSEAGQREVGILFDRLSTVWGGWLKSIGITPIIVGLTTAFELWLFGIPDAGILGVIAGFLNLVPTIGPFITYLLIIIVTYTQSSARLSLSPGALTLLVWGIDLLINQFIRLYIYPRLAGKALHLPVFLVILGIVDSGGSNIVGDYRRHLGGPFAWHGGRPAKVRPRKAQRQGALPRGRAADGFLGQGAR